MASARFLVGVAALLSLSACGVTEAELPGTWVIAASSRERLPSRFRTSESRLVLNRDGTFTALRMPPSMMGLSDDLDQANPDYMIDGSGTWTLDESRSLALWFRTLRGVPVSRGTHIVAEKGWSYLEIFYWIDGPDAGPRINLERQ